MKVGPLVETTVSHWALLMDFLTVPLLAAYSEWTTVGMTEEPMAVQWAVHQVEWMVYNSVGDSVVWMVLYEGAAKVELTVVR